MNGDRVRRERLGRLMDLLLKREHAYASLTVAFVNGGDLVTARKYADWSAHYRDRFLRVGDARRAVL